MINKPRTKGCSSCLAVKPLDEFYVRYGKPASQCKQCHRDASNAARVLREKKKTETDFPGDSPVSGFPDSREQQLQSAIKMLLARKGFRQPEWVAKQLGISVEYAARLMFPK